MSVRTVGVGMTYATIQAALDNLWTVVGGVPFTETHEIRTYNGTYTETPIPNTGLKPTAAFRLVITAAAGNFPVIDGQLTRSYGVRNNNTLNYVSVIGFIIKNHLATGIFFNGSGYGIAAKNTIFNNATGISFISANASFGSAYNNIVYLNDNGIIFQTAAAGGAAYNNTVYLNDLIGIAFNAASINGTAKNNIIYNASGVCFNVANDSQSGFISDYNDLYLVGTASAGFWTATQKTFALWKTASGQDAHSVSSNPLFLNVNVENLNNAAINSSSLCAGAGTNLTAIFTTDFNGAARPAIGAWDIGAIINAAISIPVITLQALSNYAPTQDQNITATCNVSGLPDSVVVKVNGKSFVMTLIAGTSYSVIIPAYLIGQCTAQTVTFLATNSVGGSDEVAPSTITIPAMTNYNVALMGTAITAILATITDLKSVLDHEPKIEPELPAVTLYFDGFEQSQTEVSSFTVTYKWILRLYVRLLDAKIAQDDVKNLTQQILSKLKLNLGLNGLALLSFIPSASVSAVLDKNNPIMMVEFNFTAMKEED